MKCYIRENAFPARIAAWVLKQDKMAMVVGRTILLHNTTRAEFLNNKRWLRHELAHIRQFRQHGYWGFLFKYFIESIQHGYYNNKYEREARKAEDEEGLGNDIVF